MKLVSASFYWRNDQKDGLGVTFSRPDFTSAELEFMFKGQIVADYLRNSDAQLGTEIVGTYLAQLEGIAQEARRRPLPITKALLAALNIIWLTERGFMPNDEFNGPLYTHVD